MIMDRLHQIPYYKHKLFEKHPNVFQLTTGRKGGVSDPPYHFFNLGENTSDHPESVRDNMQLLTSEISEKVKMHHIILPVQVHGVKVVRIDEAFFDSSGQNQKESVADCDALITNLPGVFIGIRTADCVPVTILDARGKTIATVHAGWRGIVNGIISKTLKMMNVDRNFDAFFCGIGPCIEGDVYRVGQEVVNAVSKVVSDEAVCLRKDGHYYLDLKKAAYYQLVNGGIQKQNIEISPFCTFKNNDVFYSYRKAKGNTGRFLTGMMLIN